MLKAIFIGVQEAIISIYINGSNVQMRMKCRLFIPQNLVLYLDNVANQQFHPLKIEEYIA